MKRLLTALGIIAGLLSPAYGSGTIPYSLSQQIDTLGKPLAGCKLFIIVAGTVAAPQIAYQDAALTIPAAGGSQLTCDAAGRLPQFFLADGTVKIRLTDKNGTTQVVADGIQVIGPSGGGGGGGGSVDPTTILATGDVKITYGTGVLSGFVRVNGRSIGSATSGATERANADCQALFQYLWSTDPNLGVSGGRGASANADWVANKTINLPDGRGRGISLLDGMGNSTAGRYSGATVSGGADTLGSTIGNNVTLGTSNLPPYTPGGSVSNGAITVTNGAITVTGTVGGNPALGGASFLSTFQSGTSGAITNIAQIAFAASQAASSASQASSSFSGSAQGGLSTPFPTFAPSILMTAYMKL